MPSSNIKGYSVSYPAEARDAVINHLYTKEAEDEFARANSQVPVFFFYGDAKYKLSCFDHSCKVEKQ